MPTGYLEQIRAEIEELEAIEDECYERFYEQATCNDCEGYDVCGVDDKLHCDYFLDKDGAFEDGKEREIDVDGVYDSSKR